MIRQSAHSKPKPSGSQSADNGRRVFSSIGPGPYGTRLAWVISDGESGCGLPSVGSDLNWPRRIRIRRMRATLLTRLERVHLLLAGDLHGVVFAAGGDGELDVSALAVGG